MSFFRKNGQGMSQMVEVTVPSVTISSPHCRLSVSVSGISVLSFPVMTALGVDLPSRGQSWTVGVKESTA